MRTAVMAMVLLLASLQSGMAETVMTAQDYAVDSDVVLESAVREIKSVPQDTVNVIGDAVKMVSDEMSTAAKGVASVFKADPIAGVEKAAALETATAWNSANDIVFRAYKISEPVGNELIAGKNIQPRETVDVSSYFIGIDFPEGASAMYRPEFKKLFVRQTSENILSIEDILADRHSRKRELMGKQVEIQTKFIEVGQNTLHELGFNWRFDEKGGGDAHIVNDLTLPAGQDIMASGLRTAAMAMGTEATAGNLLLEKTAGSLRWSLIITALEQADDSDVLSAPSVTTLNGKTANIWVGEQRKVPKSFSAKTEDSGVFIEHESWGSELMGVQLEVRPELRKGGLIDLEIKPKVIDLIGYDTYNVTPDNSHLEIYSIGNLGVSTYSKSGGNIAPVVLAESLQGTISSVVTNALGYVEAIIDPYGTSVTNVNFLPGQSVGARTVTPVPVPLITGSLPYFRLREMQTKVTVADGSTVGMGGLIYDKLETYKDKVPVLGSIPLIGRLFRSEGERSVKRNLMIFVTATQVDMNGRRASDLVMKK